MARIRTFIAVEIADVVRQNALALQQELARRNLSVKWVDAASMHITLFFLGEVDERDVVPICRLVDKRVKNLPPFRLEFTGVGAFPTLRRPKILWVGVGEGSEGLKRVHDVLEEPLLERGCYRHEDRAYAPHLTLGRLTQADRTEDCGAILAKYSTWQGGATDVDEIVIMHSELRREGPVYTMMGRAKLAGVARSTPE